MLSLGLRSRWPGAQFRSPEPLPSSEPREVKGRDPGRGSNALPQGGALLAAGVRRRRWGLRPLAGFLRTQGRRLSPPLGLMRHPPSVPELMWPPKSPGCLGGRGAPFSAGVPESHSERGELLARGGHLPSPAAAAAGQKAGLRHSLQDSERKETLPSAEIQVHLGERGPTSLSCTHLPTCVYAACHCSKCCHI